MPWACKAKNGVWWFLLRFGFVAVFRAENEEKWGRENHPVALSFFIIRQLYSCFFHRN